MFFFNVNGTEKQRLFDEHVSAARSGERAQTKTIKIPNISGFSPHKNVLTPPGDYDSGPPIHRMGISVTEAFLNGTLRASFAHPEDVPRGCPFHQVRGFFLCDNRTFFFRNAPC
jgi:hypothetical protein